MQESELNDALSRMRLQLLKDGHFSQLSGQQGDLAVSQAGLGLPQQMPHSWGPSLQSSSSSPGHWQPDPNGLGQYAANRATDNGSQAMPPAIGAGSSDGWASSAGGHPVSADLSDQGNGLWGGGLYANDQHNIWSAGLSSSPQQGGSLTAPSIGAGMLLGQEGGQQTQPISHSQQLQLLAANGIGNMSGIYNNSLGSDSFGDSSQYANGGLHGAGGLLPSNLSGLTALGNGYGGKLQQGLPNNGPPLNGFGAQQQGQDFSSLQLNGGVGGILNNGLTNAALAAKLAGLPNLGRGGGYANGLGNGSLAGMCAGSALPGANGHLSAIHGSGLPGGYTLQQQQQHHHHQQQQHLQQQQQQQQQQMLQEQLQALGPAGIAQLPPQLQAYARELLLRQQRAALMGAQLQQQPPPLPFGTPGVQGPAAAQRLDLAGFRRDIYRNELPLGRQGSRPLPPKGMDDGFLLGSQPDLLNGLPGQHMPPPPPPRAMNGRMHPPPPPPSSQAGAFQARVQQKKVIASLLQRGPSRDKAYVPGAKPKADMEQLNNELLELVESLRPKPEECQRQCEALEALRAALVKRWPDCKVHLFGSTANQLSICNNNDIDVCLELPDLPSDPNTKGEIVEELGGLLTEAGMQNVLPLPKARVPVVKFVVGENGTKVDITVNNILAIVNTKLLADYVSIDERLLQLCYVIKHWAKRRQVNDSYRGTLSSYCYVLMCIHLLQQREPPILPCLQAIKPPTHFRTVGQWVCDYYDDLEALKGFGAGNKETLAELVWAFFEYWAWKHDYNNAVISVRTGGFLTKSQKEWTRRVGNERHLVCIEDPFELTHDLGRTVDRQTNGVLHKEFERAACVLRDHDNPLEKLMEPYRAGKTE